eukprot:scaffold18951_cov63-Phaeocystis_antarctica.AAC.11
MRPLVSKLSLSVPWPPATCSSARSLLLSCSAVNVCSKGRSSPSARNRKRTTRRSPVMAAIQVAREASRLLTLPGIVITPRAMRHSGEGASC